MKNSTLTRRPSPLAVLAGNRRPFLTPVIHALLAAVLLASGTGPASTARAESYSYDAAGRLIQVAYDDGQILRYTYDENSNILSADVLADELFTDGFES